MIEPMAAPAVDANPCENAIGPAFSRIPGRNATAIAPPFVAVRFFEDGPHAAEILTCFEAMTVTPQGLGPDVAFEIVALARVTVFINDEMRALVPGERASVRRWEYLRIHFAAPGAVLLLETWGTEPRSIIDTWPGRAS